MHIAILSSPANFHTQKWAESLQAAGNKVSVFSFDDHDFSPQDIQNVRVTATFAYKGKATYLSYLDGRKLKKLLFAHKIDLVLAINATPFGVWAAKTNFHPCVIFAVGADILEYAKDKKEQTIYNWNSKEFAKDSFFSKLKHTCTKPIFQHQVAQALQFADGVMADNEVLTKAIHSFFHVPLHKIHLNRGGIEPELFLPDAEILAELKIHFKIPENATVILSPRGMKPAYQPHIVIDAFEALLAENSLPNAYFIMLSAGYDIPKSLEIKGEIMMQKYSHFFFEKNVLSRQKISQLWHLVEVFISAPVYDGYSASLAEGRYLGLIPVVNKIPANTEILAHQENAWFVVPYTAENLASALKEIMLGKEFWKKKFAQNNEKWIAENSIMPKSVKAFFDFIAKIQTHQKEGF